MRYPIRSGTLSGARPLDQRETSGLMPNSDMMMAGELRPHSGTERGQVSKPGRLTDFEVKRRQRQFEQHWLAGHSIKEAAKLARMTDTAVVNYFEEHRVRLMPHVQSEVA